MPYNQPSSMKNGSLGPKDETTKKYETRSRTMSSNVKKGGENTFAPMGVKSKVDPASGKTVNTAKPFERKVVKDPDGDKGYTSVYGEGGKRVFRGRTGSSETETFLKKSASKVKETNARRAKNADDLNAVGGDTKTWNAKTKTKAKALQNLK